MPRSLLVPLSLSGLLSVVVGPVVTQPGVVDWVAERRNPSPRAALQFTHSQPGRLQVEWPSLRDRVGRDENGNRQAWGACRSTTFDGADGDMRRVVALRDAPGKMRGSWSLGRGWQVPWRPALPLL